MARGRKHRRSKAYLSFNPHGQPCFHCGGMASTRDHIPALALHTHVEGTGCCILVPACALCNAKGGARVSALLNRQRGTWRRERRALSRREGLMAIGDIEAWVQ